MNKTQKPLKINGAGTNTTKPQIPNALVTRLSVVMSVFVEDKHFERKNKIEKNQCSSVAFRTQEM